MLIDDTRLFSNVPPRPLTPREAELAQCVAEGNSNRIIGARMGLTVATVKANVSRLLRKTRCATRMELATKVLTGAIEVREYLPVSVDVSSGLAVLQSQVDELGRTLTALRRGLKENRRPMPDFETHRFWI